MARTRKAPAKPWRVLFKAAMVFAGFGFRAGWIISRFRGSLRFGIRLTRRMLLRTRVWIVGVQSERRVAGQGIENT